MRHKAIWKNRTILVEDTIHVEKTTQKLLNPKKVWYIKYDEGSQGLQTDESLL